MTTPRNRVLLLAIGVLLVATACSTGDGDAESALPTTSAMATTSSSAAPQATTTSSSAALQATTTSSSVEAQSVPLLVGAVPVILVSPTEGGGVRPTFGWEAVDGAGSYFLVVKDEAGAAYWAWDGSETSIPLGGAEFPEDFGNGPTIGPGYTWSVSAYSADGTFLAISGDRPISP